MSEFNKHATKSTWWGPILVALGAVLWATDSVFRSQVIKGYSPLFIVFFNHALCLFFALPAMYARRRELLRLSRREVMALAFLATFGSAIAMILFTRAFALASNFTTPILMQKLQPLFAIGLARLILSERVTPRYPLWAVCALGGAYLTSFGWTAPTALLGRDDTTSALLAGAAAAIWGATTVAGRLLLARLDFLFVTAARFTFATAFIAILMFATEGVGKMESAVLHDLTPFVMMAYLSGMAPLLLYYYGLKTTPANTATLCELAFPLAAIAINWLVLDTPLNTVQLLGAGVLVTAITMLTYENARPFK